MINFTYSSMLSSSSTVHITAIGSFLFIMLLWLPSARSQKKGGVWNMLMNIKVSTLIANQSATFCEPKSWIIQWDLDFSVQCWCLAFIKTCESSYR